MSHKSDQYKGPPFIIKEDEQFFFKQTVPIEQ